MVKNLEKKLLMFKRILIVKLNFHFLNIMQKYKKVIIKILNMMYLIINNFTAWLFLDSFKLYINV